MIEKKEIPGIVHRFKFNKLKGDDGRYIEVFVLLDNMLNLVTVKEDENVWENGIIPLQDELGQVVIIDANNIILKVGRKGVYKKALKARICTPKDEEIFKEEIYKLIEARLLNKVNEKEDKEDKDD